MSTETARFTTSCPPPAGLGQPGSGPGSEGGPGAPGLDGGRRGHWALHGGGDQNLTAVARVLAIPSEKLCPPGHPGPLRNMSSPSVLFALRQIMNNGLRPADWVVMAAFGAGLSAHVMLLRAS